MPTAMLNPSKTGSAKRVNGATLFLTEETETTGTTSPAPARPATEIEAHSAGTATFSVAGGRRGFGIQARRGFFGCVESSGIGVVCLQRLNARGSGIHRAVAPAAVNTDGPEEHEGVESIAGQGSEKVFGRVAVEPMNCTQF